MSGQYILDAAHNPVPCEDLLQWARWMEEHLAERALGRTRIGPYTVATDFLGLDHNHLRAAMMHRGDVSEEEATRQWKPPLLWETAVFLDLPARPHPAPCRKGIDGKTCMACHLFDAGDPREMVEITRRGATWAEAWRAHAEAVAALAHQHPGVAIEDELAAFREALLQQAMRDAKAPVSTTFHVVEHADDADPA